ncbi:MAG: helix-turn-helix domain-containing protein [Aristaeellaceae bacterium]
MKSAEGKVAPISDYYIFTPSRTAQEIFFYPLQCGNFTYEPGYALRRSSFDSFLLMYIQKGSLLLELDGKTQPAHEKSFVLIDCYAPHGYSTRDGYECLWLHFDGVLARRYYELIVSRLNNVFTMDDAFPVLRKMNTILRTFAENKQCREPLLSKYILDILTEFMIYNPDAGKVGNCAEAVEKAMIYISEHFTENIPVSRMAAVAGMSESHFIRVFRQGTGYTPHEYIINRRMASARYLLKYSSLSVKKICFNTGFSCESVFCNAFRRQHQMTPQQYREFSCREREPNGLRTPPPPSP